jgi:hypothetical protein
MLGISKERTSLVIFLRQRPIEIKTSSVFLFNVTKDRMIMALGIGEMIIKFHDN